MAATTTKQPAYDRWPRRRARTTELFLDPENIRLEVPVQASQQSLINDLFVNENAMQVLESIARNGFFPDEFPVVIVEKGKFTVIEGNRRVAALKALSRPELVATKERAIRELLMSAVPFPRELDVVVAPDRGAVRRLLAAKHTQATRRPWSPLRQAAFYRGELASGKTVGDLRSEYPSVEIEKFLRLINIHGIAKALRYSDPEVTRKVHQERQFPASTVERLYEDQNVRDFLGFEFDSSGDVRVTIAKAEFEKGFRKVIEDVVTKSATKFGDVNSRTLNNEANRAAYLASFATNAIPKRTKARRVTTGKDFKAGKAPPKTRTKLAPKDIAFGLHSRGVHRMLVELQSIDYHRYPNATHDLLRSFLECALKAYFHDSGTTIMPRGGKYVYLDQVLDEFIKERIAAKDNSRRQVAARIRSSNNMVCYSTDFLNAVNHNPDIFVTPKDVEVAWDLMVPLLRFVLNPGRPHATKSSP